MSGYLVGVYGIEHDLPTFLLLMLAQDFCYYWFHRASHRVHWFWAAHSVHHSSEQMNFTTAFRQSLMYPVAGMWLFWLPLVIIGFPQLCCVSCAAQLGAAVYYPYSVDSQFWDI